MSPVTIWYAVIDSRFLDLAAKLKGGTGNLLLFYAKVGYFWV
jgi:hypothetical protein